MLNATVKKHYYFLLFSATDDFNTDEYMLIYIEGLLINKTTTNNMIMKQMIFQLKKEHKNCYPCKLVYKTQ